MSNSTPPLIKAANNSFSIRSLSIKSLTLLGFGLVALPLVIALIFGASQVDTLAKKSASAITNITKAMDSQQLLKSSQIKMERSAAQYLVLRDPALAESYREQSQQILLLTKELTTTSQDKKLQQWVIAYTQAVNALMTDIMPAAEKKSPTDSTIIKPIQAKFNALTSIYEQISQRSNELNTQHITRIKQAAQATRDIMFQSLVIIPISLLIAAIFVFLITSPLKVLTTNIFRLQQGDFDREIKVTGSPEIQEIAQALENMRMRLQALELQKSSFIRHISHELKTPLAAIREGTELLYDNSVGELNAEQQEISQIIKNSVFRLQKHIEDLLDFNIVLDSTSLQDSESMEINDVVYQVIADRKLDIKRKKLKINNSLSEISLFSNRKQVAVIIDNILSNAIKYSPNDGTINISSALVNNQMQLFISDQGIGISSEHQEKIFDAFYQGPPPEQSVIKGSGLGLTIVKELLLRLNGSIELLNEQENKKSDNEGTKIKITLPRAFHQEEQNQ
ncbi:HAMP domain-containing histidine kinase [Colwellia sp. Arc7-635]|uniref:HAMP domain-containing sensor histidine kinase n=1 Tax=Colwellia sp. Arc7-635 TaxID=2497879 RepID=UPI000F851A5D|nr:HAMP domain-containing sensor histidine kinase [Colwellia sp. Arc7-635]AZQ85625.1 HAMP domain-containing histidine kinase [Colwellia sp. Arc7-635]